MADLGEEGRERDAPTTSQGSATGQQTSPKRQPQTLLGRVQEGLTGPVGESGLPPSRPSSAATGLSGAGYSRRIHSVTGSITSNRPQTSQSRTHVPSVTSQAFFRPMSSQRLQAQRAQRPMSFISPNPPNNPPMELYEEEDPWKSGETAPDEAEPAVAPNYSNRASDVPISSSKPIPAHALGKNYEYFQGNTHFMFGGRLMNTKTKYPLSLFTLIIILIPAVLAYVFM
jgi:hypothetical protein